MRRRSMFIGLGSMVTIAILAIVLLPRLLGSEQDFTQAYWPTGDWRSSSPEEQGFDSGILAEGLPAMRSANLDSLLIVRNGYVVVDAYFYPYDDTIPHDLASVTKSVMTTLIGIAVDQGKLQLDRPMLSFFSDRIVANLDSRKEQVTVQHLVSMRNGFQSGCLTGDEETLNTMRSNPDWVQAALDRKMVREPGTGFCYDSPGMHLLSAILQEATGMTSLDFAQQYLFEPLGIEEAYWQSDPQGYTHGWGDLYLKPRDAAKIGYLWLHDGAWEDKQIISPSWVADSVSAYSNVGEDAYGYGWWVTDDGFFALGRNGQNIRIYPSMDAIVITTASGFNYDQITPLLLEAIVDPDAPLPANPAAVEKLELTLTALAQPPGSWPGAPLPETAMAISGKTYVFGPNSVDVSTLRIDFSDPEEAVLFINIQGEDAIWTIGLNGEYGLSSEGQGLRGYWSDSQTFVIDVFHFGLTTRQLRFDDDRIEVSSSELGFRFEGKFDDR